DQTSSIRLLAERARELGGDQLIGYHSKSGGERKLRSSNLFIRDETGELRYTLCINQDVTALLQINDYLQKFTHNLLLEQPTAPQEQLTIEELTLNIILDEIEQAKPFSLDSREGKLTILKKLDEKGIFEVRHAVPKVCQLLEIAQATLYKYLKEIKTDHTMREEQS
ncbi:MAG: helix-turn-helix domain-containing protein, partial [Clostridiales bacterium]